MPDQRPYRGLTKDGKWVKGWYCSVKTVPCFGEIRHFIIPESGLVAMEHTVGDLHESITGFIEVIPETVGQSTGLKDKKRTKEFPEGQEIYEGDIVKHPDTEQCKYSDMWIVEYEPGAWIQQRVGKGLRWPPGGDPYEKVEWDWYNIEVIGNIHQNPELLKGAE